LKTGRRKIAGWKLPLGPNCSSDRRAPSPSVAFEPIFPLAAPRGGSAGPAANHDCSAGKTIILASAAAAAAVAAATTTE